MESSEFHSWNAQTARQVQVVQKINLSIEDMRAITGSIIGARTALRHLVESSPEETYDRIVEHLGADGRTPEPIPEARLDLARMKGVPLGLVGYVVYEPNLRMRRSVFERIFGIKANSNGREIAYYATRFQRAEQPKNL